jgi:hypothetical protein
MYEDTPLPCTLGLAPPDSPRAIDGCPRRRQRGGRARTGDADADSRRSGNPAEPGTGLSERRARRPAASQTPVCCGFPGAR